MSNIRALYMGPGSLLSPDKGHETCKPHWQKSLQATDEWSWGSMIEGKSDPRRTYGDWRQEWSTAHIRWLKARVIHGAHTARMPVGVIHSHGHTDACACDSTVTLPPKFKLDLHYAWKRQEMGTTMLWFWKYETTHSETDAGNFPIHSTMNVPITQQARRLCVTGESKVLKSTLWKCIYLERLQGMRSLMTKK
jgi:hypothetical protein